ncbi:MAG TPA: CotH kinase family protein, partial [Flavobacteriales bacterium]|nr:CotH kinase family protein [Flavobacteriales bacterium]
MDHKARFRYRGVFSPSHFLGGKKSFRLTMKSDGPLSPYRKVNVINPKAFNLINDHMAAWVAGSMGVPVPMNEMVFARINDEDQGVMELFEQVDGDFHRNRHLAQHQVPVYKGDYPAITEKRLPMGRTLWANAANWEYVSKADSTMAHAKLEALILALTLDTLSIESHRDSIASLLDVDAFLRYQAALLVINSKHIDQYHNQWLVIDPRSGKFHPVLWDALMMFPPEGDALYHVHDAITWWVLRIPEWRLRRDRYAYQAMLTLEKEGRFDAQLNDVIERIKPSVLADRNKFGNVTLLPEDVHRYSIVHVLSSLVGFRESTHAHWQAMLQRMETSTSRLTRGAQLHVKEEGIAPVQLSWTGEGQPVTVNGVTMAPVETNGAWTIVLHHQLVPAKGSKDHPLADHQHFDVRALDATVVFANGTPASLRITNAI